jgi:hypothetical protein
LKITFFDLDNSIKIVTIYKKFYSNHDFLLENFFKSVANRKEPEAQFVISAQAPGVYLISTPRLWLLNTGKKITAIMTKTKSN